MITGVTTIYGEPGTCKTSIALTWPKPIAVYDLENGLRRAWGIGKLLESGSVVKHTVTIPTKSLTIRYSKLTGYSEAWQSFTGQVQQDLDSKKFKTILWDTGTTIWSLVRDGYLQELQSDGKTRKQLQQIEYGEPNRRMETLYQLVKAYDIHLVVTHHEKDEYINELAANGKPITDQDGNPKSITSGNKLPDGFKQTLALSDLVLFTTLKDNKPIAKITKSLYGLSLRGEIIEWPTYELLDSRVNFHNMINNHNV